LHSSFSKGPRQKIDAKNFYGCKAAAAEGSRLSSHASTDSGEPVST